MKSPTRWQFVLVGRVLANALFGGVLAATVGTIGLGASGASQDWLGNSVFPFPANSPGRYDLFNVSVLFGISVGLILGALIFGIAAGKSAPGRLFAPLKELAWRVSLGQLVGIAGAASSFYAFEAVKATLNNESFAYSASLDMAGLLFGAPVLMICGAIAGALSKRPDTR